MSFQCYKDSGEKPRVNLVFSRAKETFPVKDSEDQVVQEMIRSLAIRFTLILVERSTIVKELAKFMSKGATSR